MRRGVIGDMASLILLLPMIIMLVAMLAVLAVYASRYKKVPPDKAMVIYGRKMHPRAMIGYMILSGGGKFLLPIVEDVKYMDLGLKQVVLELDNLRTDPSKGAEKVRINLVALYKISGDRSALPVACEHLLDKTAEDIKRMTEVMIEGHFRGIAATMTAEQIDRNRTEVEDKLRLMAWHDLLNIGIDIKAFAIIRVQQKGVM
jgi:flotillin